MGKAKAQGTRWETEIVKRAKAIGMYARRLPLQGVKGEPDVEVEAPEGYMRTIGVLFWKRLTPSKGGQRRSPDGAADVVVLTVDDFLWLYELATLSEAAQAPKLLVQAKATERLNVTRILGDLKEAIGALGWQE